MQAWDQFKDSYRSLLKIELEKRCGRNPRYSLRSFARDLELSPSRLCDVMRGRYGLSRTAAQGIAARIGMTKEEADIFCDLVDREHARKKAAKNDAQQRLKSLHENQKTQQLSLDSFQIISEWYHYAILELTLIKGFKSDVHWIASELGISPHVAIAAIERLKRLDLIEKRAGKLRATDAFSASPSGIPSDALKKFHTQLLQKAIDAIQIQSLDERDITSMVLAFEKKRMKEAKEWIRDFRRGFDAHFGKSKKKDQVYCLAVQFFRLQEKEERRKK
jgi:uncharacterized protein (TIGR02147 family)